MKYYLIRLDDACPEMDATKWQAIEDILGRYGLKPLVGIIPNNQDPQTIKDNVDNNFYDKARRWQEKGWAIALHGYNHVCTTEEGGINPVHRRSEFAGLPLSEQITKIGKGYTNLINGGLIPRYFFAPSHTYDKNTLKALEEVTPIRIISDTIALRPYSQYGFTFVPCQMGKFRTPPFNGYWTFCFHPNEMDNVSIAEFEEFIKDNVDKFIAFDEINFDNIRRKSLVDRLLSAAYFVIRRLR